MLLQFEIERYTDAIIRSTRRGGHGQPLNLARLKRYLNDAILLTEGFENHLSALNERQLRETYRNITEVKRKLVEISEEIGAEDYSSDAAFKEQFHYLLNTLSALKAQLHIRLTKDVPVSPTPADLKHCLSELSLTAAAKRFYGPAS